MIMNMQGSNQSNCKAQVSHNSHTLRKAPSKLTGSQQVHHLPANIDSSFPQISLTKFYNLNTAIFQQLPSTQDPFSIFHFNALVINKLQQHLLRGIKKCFYTMRDRLRACSLMNTLMICRRCLQWRSSILQQRFRFKNLNQASVTDDYFDLLNDMEQFRVCT